MDIGNTRKGNEMKKLIDITGNKYNRLEVIGLSHIENRRSYWICKCDCGKIVVLRKDYFAYKWSKVKSCGCLHRENSSFLMYELHRRRKNVDL